MPHKKVILFESGDNPFDNGFVLANYFAHHNEYNKYRLVCIGKKEKINDKFFDKKIKYLHYSDSIKSRFNFLKYSLRAKYIFYSYDNLWKFMKLRKTTKIVFIRHGAFPLKDVTEYYDSMFDNDNSYYCLCNTEFVKEHLELKYSKPNVSYIICGMPRSDLLKIHNEDKTFASLEISKNSKVIIFGCTFRKFNDTNTSFFEDEFQLKLSNKDIVELNDFASKNNLVLLFKLHHAQLCSISDYNYSNILFVDNKKLEEYGLNNFDLFNISSALITDYSGIFIDYLLTNKPLGFILSDFDQYRHNRGFTIPNFEDLLPGYKIYTIGDLIQFLMYEINDINKYKEHRLRVKDMLIGNYGDCSKSLIDEVSKL